MAIIALTACSGPSDDHEWDGSESYSDGTLETAEVRETNEAYEGVLTLNIQFDSADFGNGFTLQTNYDEGELDFSGGVTSDVRESVTDSVSDSSGNGSFRCNDGRSWGWQPLRA